MSHIPEPSSSLKAKELAHCATMPLKSNSRPASDLLPIHTDTFFSNEYETFIIGLGRKAFAVNTKVLINNSVFFSTMVHKATNGAARNAASNLIGPLTLPEVDEFAFSNFRHWLDYGLLKPPQNYHALSHHICLYMFANKFGFEVLQNLTMDQVREYYRNNDMSAPPSRLVCIYQSTDGPGLMRKFLVYTAAQRAVAHSRQKGQISVSRHIRRLIAKGGDLANDYVDALIALELNPELDVRSDTNCNWHDHSQGRSCR